MFPLYRTFTRTRAQANRLPRLAKYGFTRGIASGARPEPPKFRYIAAIAVLSTVAFAVSVRSLEKKAPITEMSAAEYEDSKKKNILRYKRSAFRPGETFVVLDPQSLYVDKQIDGYTYINIEQILESDDPEINRYHHIVQGFKRDKLPLPIVTKQAIIQDAMKYHLGQGHNRFIIGGDSNGLGLDEAIKFEQDVAPVDVLVTFDPDSVVAKYFGTVGKTKKSL